MALTGVPRELAAILEGRQRRTAAIHTSRVVGRNDDGTLRLQRIDGECVTRGCVTGEGEGELMARPAGACWERLGTTGVAALLARGTAGVLWVERLEPAELVAGQVYSVAIHGRGFSGDVSFDFLAPASELVNASIAVAAIRYVSPTLMEVDLAVAADAEPVRSAALAYDRGQPAGSGGTATALRRRRGDAYGVLRAAAAADPEGVLHEELDASDSVAWDSEAEALLFARLRARRWHAEGDPGVITHPGYRATEISRLAAAQMPLADPALGELAAEIYRSEGGWTPYGETVHAIVATPARLLVWWHRSDEWWDGPPTVLRVATVDRLTGYVTQEAEVSLPGPEYSDHISAVSRLESVWAIEPDPAGAVGAATRPLRVVRRSASTAGLLAAMPFASDYQEPVAVCLDPATVGGAVYIFYTSRHAWGTGPHGDVPQPVGDVSDGYDTLRVITATEGLTVLSDELLSFGVAAEPYAYAMWSIFAGMGGGIVLDGEVDGAPRFASCSSSRPAAEVNGMWRFSLASGGTVLETRDLEHFDGAGRLQLAGAGVYLHHTHQGAAVTEIYLESWP